MKDIRIFIASSKELIQERNELAFLVLAKEDEFAARGLRVRLAKWEYVDPKMTAGRTEDRYLDEMYNCDAAMVIFKNIAGMYTREELDKALVREAAGSDRIKAHKILFSTEGDPKSDAAKLRASLPEENYGVYANLEELKAAFLALVDELVDLDKSGAPNKKLLDAAPETHMRRITAFLAADDELISDRNAFADTVLNLNDLLEFRNLRVQLRFCGSGLPNGKLQELVANSEIGLVLYGTNVRAFGQAEMDTAYNRTCRGENPKKLYVFFRDDEGKELSSDFKAFRDSFVDKLGHFVCQFGGPDTLRLNFLLSLERYAGETVEIYSTVATLTAPFFVGREEELRKLHELLAPTREFPAGRLPVITGAGGTGKSELVRQYASQFRVQYPGGVFQVDMEHARTWDDAFLGVLKGTSNNGVKVADYLDLNIRGSDGDNRKEPITGVKVRDALLQKSRNAGPMLLVLDNVEGCMPLFGRDGGFAKAFPAGFSERVLVNVVATARVCDTMLRPDDWAVPFPLGDISKDAALELLLEGRTEVNEEERSAAARIAELLGYRALYLKRVPALIGDLYADVVCDSYVELAKALEENLLETVAVETEGTHLPSVLWKMTCERLEKVPLGKECIRLAQVASFFSPDGFAQHILMHLWKTVAAPGLDDRKFNRAVAILKYHNVFQSTDPVRLHRLDRAAILGTTKTEQGIEDCIGKALSAYGWLLAEDWAHVAEFEGIRRHVPEEVRNMREFWVTLLFEHPEIEECPWELLEGADWAELLCVRPQLTERCRWEKLSGEDWTLLLCERPEFSNRCPWKLLTGRDWGELLSIRPQFEDKCPWELLDGSSWSKILSRQPQYECRCPWEKMGGSDWCELLCCQPHFADQCNWGKLEGWDWCRLLCRHPQLANRYTWSEIHDWFWQTLLMEQPQFAGKCPQEHRKGGYWSGLLCSQPQRADDCPWGALRNQDWVVLLRNRPEFADRCPWGSLDGFEWMEILECQVQLADWCPWESFVFAGFRWCLARDFAWDGLFLRVFERISPDRLSCAVWMQLLRTPFFHRLIHRCPYKISGEAWAGILREQPQLAGHCDWTLLNGDDWSSLLSSQPCFSLNCNWNKLNGDDWRRLLTSQPQFSEYCDWDKLVGSDWAQLIDQQRQFASRCAWEKLRSEDWKRLLNDWRLIACRYPRLEAKSFELEDGCYWSARAACFPESVTVCPWWKLSGVDWYRLLSVQRQFLNECPWFRPFDDRDGIANDGENWRLPLEIVRRPALLSDESVLARFEELVRFDAAGKYYSSSAISSIVFLDDGKCICAVNPWAFVLYWRPELAERCAHFEMFNGASRCLLLIHQPQFSDRWSMEDLSDRNSPCWANLKKRDFDNCWARLIAAQPRFAKYHKE